MCCFSRAVPFVGGTKIFARGLADGQQLLVYAMNVELDAELAMILPLPVAHGSGDDAVRFIDLEGEEGFFEQLASAFPPVAQPATRSFQAPSVLLSLPVIDVGQYEASFVPTASDFARLDPRFRLPNGFLQALPVYADYGFAVFRLKPAKTGRKRQAVQPMALAFPRREPRALFFPTVHVHDGSVPAQAAFDHALYCQADGVLEATLGWARSTTTLGAHLHGARSQSLVDGPRGGFLQPLFGSLTNTDLWLREPRGVVLEDLQGEGEHHRFEIKATAAYAFGWGNIDRALWIPAASERLAKLCRGVREGLPQLTAARREAWRLTPLHDSLPAHFMNGQQLWRGKSYLDGARVDGGGPGRIRFTPFSRHVEPQVVSLGFARLPDEDGARAINAELAALLERAVA